MPPGLCKTMTAIRATTLDEGWPALVICRKDDVLTWQTELSLEWIDETQISLITSKTTQDTESFRGKPWRIVTYDLISKPQVQALLASVKFGTIILDESHAIKSFDALRTRRTLALIDHCRQTNSRTMVVALTGTPITNELTDIFSQALAVDQGRTFGTSYWHFLNKYYIKSGYNWHPRANARKEISDLMKSFSYTESKSVLKLPPRQRKVIVCSMSPLQRQLTEQVVTQWQLDNMDISYATTQISKLRQIASGFFYAVDPQTKEPITVELPHEQVPKFRQFTRSIKERLDIPGSKTVVWCAHTAEIERIATYLTKKRIKVRVLTGSMKTSERVEARQAFANDPAVRVFIAAVDLGVGMNELKIADTAFYYSNTYKVVSRKQSEARTHRKGSEMHSSVSVVDFVCRNSIEEEIYRSTSSKSNVAENLVKRIQMTHPDKRSEVIRKAALGA